MPQALLIVSSPGSDPRWPLARVAGLPAVERNLMALRSAGASRARVACGAAEFEVLSAHFASRARDRRLPEIVLEPLGANPPPCAGRGGEAGGTADAPLVVDGRFVYHPRLLERMLAGGPQSPEPGKGAGPALYVEAVATPAGRRQARRAIRQSLRKPTDGWFARTIDRSVSLTLSSLLAPLPVHPNAVTLGTLGVGVIAGLLAARGTYWALVAAGALFLLASVLDGVDGEIARMKFQGSPAGQWLDTVCDDLTNAVYLAGVTAGTWRAYASPWLLTAGIAALTLDVITVVFLYWQLVTTVNARTLLAFEETVLAPALEQPGLAGLVARLQPFVKRDAYAPLFLAFSLAGAAWLVLPATALAIGVTLVFLLRDFAGARRGATRVGAA